MLDLAGKFGRVGPPVRLARRATYSLQVTDTILTTARSRDGRIRAKAAQKGVASFSTRGYGMAKKGLARSSTLHLAGAEVTARDGLSFAFTCETLSDGTPRTIYANVKVMNSGEVNVCDYEVWRGQIHGMGDAVPMLFPDSDSIEESSLEGYCLADFVSRAQ